MSLFPFKRVVCPITGEIRGHLLPYLSIHVSSRRSGSLRFSDPLPCAAGQASHEKPPVLFERQRAHRPIQLITNTVKDAGALVSPLGLPGRPGVSDRCFLP